MREDLAVPVVAPSSGTEAWTTRIQKVASLGSQQCGDLGTVHSAVCTITGTPDELTINLACTAKAEEFVSELMQHVDDVVIPRMEKTLGIQFEVRNLQFAVAGRENLARAPELLNETSPNNWLEHPFSPPASLTTAEAEVRASEKQSELSMV